jgi:hypothetical protein
MGGKAGHVEKWIRVTLAMQRGAVQGKPRLFRRLAIYNSAIRQIKNLRYNSLLNAELYSAVLEDCFSM